MTHEEYQAQTKANVGSAIGHFHEKLFRLESMMKTKPAQIMAMRRHSIMKNFVEEIEDEYAMW